MRTSFSLAFLALFLALVAPSECFALWDTLTLTPEQAEDSGLEVRVSGNPDSVTFELEFSLDDEFKEFERVDLLINSEGESVVTAPLREERTDAGRVVVYFFANRDQLETLSVQIIVPGGPGVTGGTFYVIPVSDFVE